MKLIYIAHPFSGKQENVRRVEEVIKNLLAVFPDNRGCRLEKEFAQQHNMPIAYIQINSEQKETICSTSFKSNPASTA